MKPLARTPSARIARDSRHAVPATCSDDGLSAFLSVRPRLFGIACRMLGSGAEAEDIVQDVWVRWQTTDRSAVRDAAAFLATTTTRLAINVMQSARSRRETYVGTRLPEQVDTNADAGLGTERGEALELGVLILLEKLSPSERAAYILREAFDYPYRDIANVLRLEEANARQVVTRARRHVADGRRMPASSTEHRRLLGAFTAVAQNGDVAGFERLLARQEDRTSAYASCAGAGQPRSGGCHYDLRYRSESHGRTTDGQVHRLPRAVVTGRDCSPRLPLLRDARAVDGQDVDDWVSAEQEPTRHYR